MKTFFLVSVAVLLSSCGWQTNRALLADDPEEKTMHVGSHIPVKDKDNVQPGGTGDADAMMRSQRGLNAGGSRAN